MRRAPRGPPDFFYALRPGINTLRPSIGGPSTHFVQASVAVISSFDALRPGIDTLRPSIGGGHRIV
jgi:hypothetical protein